MPKTVQYNAGSFIYFRGDLADRIFILQTGEVHLIYQDGESGQVLQTSVALNGFFGIHAAYGSFPRDEDAFVLQDASLKVFTVSEFEAFAVQNIPILLKVLKVHSHQLRRLNTYFSRVLKNEALSPEVGLFNIGIYYYKRGRFSQAKYVFEKYLASYPSGSEAVTAIKYLEIMHLQNLEPTAVKSPLPDGESAALSRFGRTFQPREIIFSEYERGDTFYMIQSGCVELTKIIGDIEKKITVLQPSELFGEMALLEGSPRSAMAIAVDTVQVLEFNRQNFELLMQTNSQIALKLLKMFTIRIHDAKRRFMILNLDTLEAKVADVFLMLDENQGREQPFDRREFNITVEDVAQWAGITVKDAQNTINRFINNGRIVLYSNKIVINNIVELARLVTASRRKQASSAVG